jgi:hypothetical protein
MTLILKILIYKNVIKYSLEIGYVLLFGNLFIEV